MADRTWNAVDARLYEEMWSKEARLIMGVLIARCPNPYGVYEIPYLILSTLFTKDEIKNGLSELADLDEPPLRLYRNNKVVWIVKKWSRAGEPNVNQQKGALNEVQGHFQEVWKDFHEQYKGILRGIKPHRISESESDTESEIGSKKKIPAKEAGDNEYVKVWINLYRELRSVPKYKATGREIGELKRVWLHLGSDMTDFKLICTNYLSSEFVKNPSAKKLYESGIESYRTTQKRKVEPLRRYER